jgi:hypothetical protein
MADVGGVLVAEAGVALRAAVVAAFGYGSYGFVSGSALSWTTYGKVAAALFVAANVVFWLLRWYAPHIVDAADTMERNA